MFEKSCRSIIFHFNKHSLIDASLPPWVIITSGKTFYVNHVDCKVGWNTKETPQHNSTKGAIKITKALLKIDDENNAIITELTADDKERLSSPKEPYTRILIFKNICGDKIKNFMKSSNIKHTKIEHMLGSCGSSFDICDIKQKSDLTLLSLTFTSGEFRILMENEIYYKAYDEKSLLSIDVDYYSEEDEDDY